MKIFIASDHAAISMKSSIADYVIELGYEVIDLGPETSDSVDYPDYAHKLCQTLLSENENLQIQGLRNDDEGSLGDLNDLRKNECNDAVGDLHLAKGILLCGSGLGMSIAANRHKGIRAALCHIPEYASLSRQHNDANVLVLGARFLDDQSAKEIAKAWLETDFEAGRHQGRVSKIEL